MGFKHIFKTSSENQEPERIDSNPVLPEPHEWYQDDYEGQLSVDVYQTDASIIIRSTIAGVRPDDLDITVHNDVVTIRGKRFQEVDIPRESYLYQECYWGGFSRSIVLPTEVDADGISASLKNGVLTVTLRKVYKPATKVQVASAD